MRIISTLLLLFISCFSFAQPGTIQKPAGIRVGCCRSCRIPDNSKPLIVVDGVLLAGDTLGKINPNDIQRIEIIKNAEATALFGTEGVNGAILITLKLIYKKVTIKDAVNKSPIAAATVSFSFPGRENTLRYIADDSGVILSNSWNKLAQSEMNVSAVGYKTLYRKRPGNDSVIYLERDVKICEEVVLTQTFCPKRTGCCVTLYCKCSGIWIKNDSVQAAQAGRGITGLNIYPNPVQKGAALNIRLAGVDSISAIRVLSLDGSHLLQQSISRVPKSIFRLETDPRWAAGIYIIQLICENGRVAASGKIIIR